jgi:hypothetical protein
MATRSSRSCFVSPHSSWRRHVLPLIPPGTVPPDFEAHTRWNQWNVVLGGLEAQPLKPPRVAYSIRDPHVLDACLVGPQMRRQHDPLLHFTVPVNACRCQPPRLVTQLLQSLNQDSTLVLPCSRFIDTNPYDLHLRCRPPSPNYTPAHHKARDDLSTHKLTP